MNTTIHWHPISTAPRDLDVLVCGIAMGTPKMDIARLEKIGSYPEKWSLQSIGSFACDGDLDYEPTHWATLPEFPYQNQT